MSADSPTLAVAADTVSILGVDVAAVAYEPTIERLLAAITHRDRLRVHSAPSTRSSRRRGTSASGRA